MALRTDKFVIRFIIFPILKIIGSIFETLLLFTMKPWILHISCDALLFKKDIVFKISIAGISNDRLRILPMSIFESLDMSLQQILIIGCLMK